MLRSRRSSTLNADVSLTQVEHRDGVIAHHLHWNAAHLARAGTGDSYKQELERRLALSLDAAEESDFGTASKELSFSSVRP